MKQKNTANVYKESNSKQLLQEDMTEGRRRERERNKNTKELRTNGNKILGIVRIHNSNTHVWTHEESKREGGGTFFRHNRHCAAFVRLKIPTIVSFSFRFDHKWALDSLNLIKMIVFRMIYMSINMLLDMHNDFHM